MARKGIEVDDELNLVPIMNLVTILIPFLLMSAQFISFAVIDSSLPAIGAPTEVDEKDEDEEDKLMLSVLISSNGFNITGADKVLPEDDEVNGPKVACKDPECGDPDSYDYEALTKRLTVVKERWPDELNVILVPDAQVQYEVIVRTMDATRDDQDDRDGDQRPRELFPNVVIAAGVDGI